MNPLQPGFRHVLTITRTPRASSAEGDSSFALALLKRDRTVPIGICITVAASS